VKEMKRLLFVALMMTCSVSWAEWELIGESGDNDKIHLLYVDKSTISINGAISRMWELKNFPKVQTTSSGARYMSSKALYAYNCIEKTSAIISIFLYPKATGKGNIVESASLQDRELKWQPIAPAAVEEFFWKIACEKE